MRDDRKSPLITFCILLMSSHTVVQSVFSIILYAEWVQLIKYVQAYKCYDTNNRNKTMFYNCLMTEQIFWGTLSLGVVCQFVALSRFLVYFTTEL